MSKQVSKKVYHKTVFSNRVHEIMSDKTLTETQKMDAIKAAYYECSYNIRTLRAKKIHQKKTARARAERGYVPKQKTTKEQWEKIKLLNNAA